MGNAHPKPPWFCVMPGVMVTSSCLAVQQQPVPCPIRHLIHSVHPQSQLLLTLGQSCRKPFIFCFNLLSLPSCVVPGPTCSFSSGIKLSTIASFPLNPLPGQLVTSPLVRSKWPTRMGMFGLCGRRVLARGRAGGQA